MDANTLRLILIVVGGLLLVGLYAWERRRARPDEDEAREEEQIGTDDRDDDKLEPHIGSWSADEGGEGRKMDVGGDRWTTGESLEPPDGQMGFERPAMPREGDAAPGAPKSPLILTFHVTPIAGTFDGPAIVHAASGCGIDPGEMDIFYRYAESDTGTEKRVLFNMANMVKPGTFPFGAMAEFESPGLALFSQADGASDDPERLEVMLAAAHCLAAELGAEVRDDNRVLLTPEKEGRLRDRVLELVTWRLSNPAQE